MAGRAFSPSRGLTAVLDAGSAKTVCLIAETNARAVAGQPAVRVVGLGHQQSRGIKAGVVVDLGQAEETIRAVIATAERMAGVTLQSIHVAAGSGRLQSSILNASAEIEGGHVTARDIARMVGGARAYVERDGRRVVYLDRLSTCADGAIASNDPVGLAARHMTARMLAVSAGAAEVANLTAVLQRCHLSVNGLTPAPAAAALVVTSEDERQLGVTVIDIGAETTKLARFSGGQPQLVRAIPFGGAALTSDIARVLHAPLIEAERIKALYGNVFVARSDEHETFSYPGTGFDEGDVRHASRAELAAVIRPRIEELLHAIAMPGDDKRAEIPSNETVVLTGGGALLTGLAGFASTVLERPVRVGQIEPVSGLPPVAQGAGFSAAAGLLKASAGTSFADGQVTVGGSASGASDLDEQSYFARVGAWLKGSF